jgi:hypothetical protein
MINLFNLCRGISSESTPKLPHGLHRAGHTTNVNRQYYTKYSTCCCKISAVLKSISKEYDCPWKKMKPFTQSQNQVINVSEQTYSKTSRVKCNHEFLATEKLTAI